MFLHSVTNDIIIVWLASQAQAQPMAVGDPDPAMTAQPSPAFYCSSHGLAW